MRPCTVLRVFTREGVGGNPLGVIVDVTGLETEGMQRIATELGFSETIYIDWAAGEVPTVRIFTPAAELPFAGHPLVGAAWVLSAMGPGGVDAMRCGIGEVRFAVEGSTATVQVPMAGEVSAAGDGAVVAARFGLPEPLRSWRVLLPQEYLVFEGGHPGEVAAAAPDMEALRSGPGTYLVATEGDRVTARFFAPALGVPEDPATGSAAVALAAIRVAQGEAAGSLRVFQGAEVGMPSLIEISWDGGVARLGGEVVRDETRVLDD